MFHTTQVHHAILQEGPIPDSTWVPLVGNPLDPQGVLRAEPFAEGNNALASDGTLLQPASGPIPLTGRLRLGGVRHARLSIYDRHDAIPRLALT